MSRTAALLCSALALAAWGAPPVPTEVTTDAPVVPGTGGRRAVSLKEALALAAVNSPDLAMAKAQAAQVESQALRVWGAMLPEIMATGSVVYTSAPSIFYTSQFLGGFGRAFNLGPPDSTVASQFKDVAIQSDKSTHGTLMLNQTLITPQMLLIPASDDGVQSARLGALEAREQILLATARIYLSIQGIAQLEVAARDAEGVALKREKDAKNQLAVGMAVEVNLLRAQADTAQARTTLAQLAGQREALLALLETFTGEAVRPDDSDGTALDFGPAAAATNEPWENTYLIRSRKKGYEALSAFHLYDRLLWMPSLSAQLRGNYNSDKGFTGTNTWWDASLNLVFPIYDRNQRYSAMHEDDAKAAEQLAKLEGDRRRAKATWVGAQTNLSAAEAALVQAESQLNLATRAQKQLESAYQAGVATSLELSDMDNKRFLAASSVAQARSQVQVRKVELAAAEGRLAEIAGIK